MAPIAADREQARRIIGDERFVEIFCDAPIEACEARDDRQLYERARRGEIEGLTGVDAPYEAPVSPAVRLDTVNDSIEQNVEKVLSYLVDKGLL